MEPMSNIYLRLNAYYEYNTISFSLLVILPFSPSRKTHHEKVSATPALAQNRRKQGSAFGGRPSPPTSTNPLSNPPSCTLPFEPLVGPSLSGLAFSPGCCSPATSLGSPLRPLSVIYVSEASGSPIFPFRASPSASGFQPARRGGVGR